MQIIRRGVWIWIYFPTTKRKTRRLPTGCARVRSMSSMGRSISWVRAGLLRRAILADKLSSSIFFGPPGSGKSTLAEIIANTTKSAFRKVNAVTTGVKEVRGIIAEADQQQKLYGAGTYLLLDECHRWSKAQSDSILPAIEKGIIKFIGSTTENPLVSMTPAIVSRCRLFQFYPLGRGGCKKRLRCGAIG